MLSDGELENALFWAGYGRTPTRRRSPSCAASWHAGSWRTETRTGCTSCSTSSSLRPSGRCSTTATCTATCVVTGYDDDGAGIEIAVQCPGVSTFD
jgi:hypothetical protein